MNLLFAGTPDFAVPSLKALMAAGHTACAVYTRPDRPAGRGRALTASPVRVAAEALGLPVETPVSLKSPDEHVRLVALAPEVMIVVAYGLILPQAVLDLPRLGCLNIHASLLPRWRGAAPIARAIEAGDTETGVCIMQMEAGLDTGPVLRVVRTPISHEDTSQNLHDRLSELGAQEIVAALDDLAHGRARATPQDAARATYARKLDKTEACLDWSQPAKKLHDRIRAFVPRPVAWTTWRGARLRVLASAVANESPAGLAGTVLEATADRLVVATGHGALRLLMLQSEGGRALGAREFLNGNPIAVGERMGDPS